ncbi:hypothetical protein [Parasphingorhabdus sp.]|uniref:hypothetical protein n=1 Tax=Parasphingorhabdus sp. TaxID=2709688 RepID=UPI003A910FB1
MLLSSLPWAYQKLLIAPSQSTELVEYTRPVPASDQGEIIQRRLEMIDEALDYPPRSPERKHELERAAKKYRTTVRTLQRYIQRLEESGGDANALANQRPSNSGAKRVHVSRTFDQAFVKAGYANLSNADLAMVIQARGISDKSAIAAIVDFFSQSRVKRDLRQVNHTIRKCQLYADGAPVTAEIVKDTINS